MLELDLRSDLCSLPTDEMWEAMRAAQLGWASRGEDAAVNELCATVAELLGKADAVWVPTCGMANLVALLTFCEPGDSVVLESLSHILTSEAMGIVEVAKLHPVSVYAADGRPDPAAVDEALAETRAPLLVLENTHTRAGGRVLSVEQTEALGVVARAHDARIHIDGARLLNAAVALGVEPARLAGPANSVALSLNKGLSAPIGSVLAGSTAVVDRARTMLTRLGGATVHRAGIPAAAGLVALRTMVDRLADDHANARLLADELATAAGLRVATPVETNIVLVDASETELLAHELVALLAGVGVGALPWGTSGFRLVTHRLVGQGEVVEAASRIRRAIAERAAAVES